LATVRGVGREVGRSGEWGVGREVGRRKREVVCDVVELYIHFPLTQLAASQKFLPPLPVKGTNC